MSWGWLILAFFVGTGFGLFVIGLLAAGATESSYRAGFCEGHREGHTAGFNDCLAEYQKVG